MPRLLQHRLDPSSRLARLMFAEYGVSIDLEDIKPWTRDPRLLEINPAGTVPILVENGEPPVVGTLAVIHAIEDRYVPAAVDGLFPAHAALRNEMWRLLVKRDQRGMTPEPGVLRVAKANLAEHLHYFNWLFATRHWMAGDDMTLADFALAAHLSSLDYLGDVQWGSSDETRQWYARIKSRPAFRTLLNDRVVGMPAAAGYADLDF